MHARVAADGTTRGVLGSTSIRLRFDRFLDPVSPTRQAICLQPTIAPAASYLDCEGTDFLQPTYDPARREVVFLQRAGARLAPQTTYQLTVFRPIDPSWPGFRAFDGAAIDAATTFQLTTAATDPPLAKDELPAPGDRYCEDAPCGAACAAAPSVKACAAACTPSASGCAEACEATCRAKCPEGVATVLRACASGACHAPSASPEGAAAGLDLSTPAGLDATALERVAHATQVGEHAARAEARPVRFGRSMPIVAPGFPGNSFLLYAQLLGEAYVQTEAAPAHEEIERLREALGGGMPMPPSLGAWPGLEALRAETTWVALGAATRTCP